MQACLWAGGGFSPPRAMCMLVCVSHTYDGTVFRFKTWLNFCIVTHSSANTAFSGSLTAADNPMGQYETVYQSAGRFINDQEFDLTCQTMDADVAEAINLTKRTHETLHQGNAKEALALSERALAVFERELGPHHADTAGALLLRGECLVALQRYGEADPLLERALKVRESVIGPVHPLVAHALLVMATSFDHQGKAPRAKPLLQRAVAIFDKCGPASRLNALELDRCVTCLTRLGAIYSDAGDFPAAMTQLDRVLALQEGRLGATHVQLVSTLNAMALIHCQQGKLALALPLYVRALAICEENLGASDDFTAMACGNLGRVHRGLRQAAQALPFLRRALAIHERSLGSNNVRVAAMLHSIAACVMDAGKPSHVNDAKAEARPLLTRSLAIYQAQLGHAHAQTVAVANALAALDVDAPLTVPVRTPHRVSPVGRGRADGRPEEIPAEPGPALPTASEVGAASSVSVDPVCGTCRRPGASQRCMRCRAVWYCDRQCQVSGWDVHKPLCVAAEAHQGGAAAAAVRPKAKPRPVVVREGWRGWCQACTKWVRKWFLPPDDFISQFK